MREADLERRLARGVTARGGMSVKIAPTVAGVPDRLVLWPGGVVQLVELKASGGRLRPIQQVWHERAAALGVTVLVLTGTAELDRWLAEFDIYANSG